MKQEQAILNVLENFRTYNFHDQEADYGTYFINETDPEKIRKALEEYKEREKYPEITEFLEFLENEKGHIVIGTDEDYGLFF